MNMVRIVSIILALSLSISAGGCASLGSFSDRSYAADSIACKSGFAKEYIKAGNFTLLTYQRFKAPCESIRIYIEGDGRAWEARNKLSDDPTPSDPVALKLASADDSYNVAYIARPGQFPGTGFPECDPTYWSQRRFAPEVVESFDKVIDMLKKKSGASKVELVGYSGGGALAVLVAARRSDITALRTVAGNLDPKAFCAYHNVSQLDGSMDPLDYVQETAHIPQRHFVGVNDKIVPAFIARSFVSKQGVQSDTRITVVDGVRHDKGWQERWTKLLAMPVD